MYSIHRDWRLDSQNPAGSDLFAPQNFGGTGQMGSGCVMNGVAAGWISVTGPNAGQCLRRCTAWGALYSPESISALLQSSNGYDALVTNIESGPHLAVHSQLGGSCGDFTTMAYFSRLNANILIQIRK